ncbi:MAG: ECF transporter S component [Candidatus Bathyarchaeia archaeon]|nr:ECF transporter S component [Candidatus Bathyarchaeota archaeon]
MRPWKGRGVLEASLAAVFTALVAATTIAVRIPVPATGGYINVGDAVIFAAALSMGWLVGGAAGGIGSAIADMVGYPVFAPFTLVIKGLEGLVAGWIADGTGTRRDLIAWGSGSAIMVAGYFLSEAYLMRLGVAAALVEVPGNIAQIAFGGLVGIPVARVIRRRILDVIFKK